MLDAPVAAAAVVAVILAQRHIRKRAIDESTLTWLCGENAAGLTDAELKAAISEGRSSLPQSAAAFSEGQR